jgi:hypothetical protein
MADGKQTNGVNGPGSKSGSTTVPKSSSSSGGPVVEEKLAPIPDANRAGIETAFSQHGQLIHASRDPIPTQNGFGTYSAATKKGKLSKDVKHIKWKGTVQIRPFMVMANLEQT